MQPNKAPSLPRTPTIGYAVVPERMAARGLSAVSVRLSVASLRARHALWTLGCPGIPADGSVLVTYAPHQGAGELGLLLHPAISEAVCPASGAHLGTAVARLAAAAAFDEAAFVTAAMALRVVHGASTPPGIPHRSGRPMSGRRHAQVLESLERQAGRAISVADVARSCGLSSNHFSRTFRAAHGMTPSQWLILRRVERAQVLMLETTLGLAAIALECGFCEQAHFSRQFSKVVGVTPGAWRRGNGVQA